MLKVPRFLAVLHGGFGDAVIGAGTPLSDSCCSDLGDDVVAVGGGGFHTPSADDVADGADTDNHLLYFLIRLGWHEVGVRNPLTTPADAAALVAEVDGGNLKLLSLDVFPDIHFGPVRERENPHVLTRVQSAVVEIPDLRALVLGIPLAEAVSEAEEALLGTGLLLIATRSAYATIEAELLDRGQQDGDLELVAADLPRGLHSEAFLKRLIHGADNEFGAEFLGAAVTEFEKFGKLVSCCNVQEGERNVRRAEGLLRKSKQADRVFASGEENRRAFKLRGDFAHDVDRLSLEVIQVVQMIAFHG